jgi:DNA-binding transcriptional regulator YiaG
VKNAMTSEELKAKCLSMGFRSRNALTKALGVSKYAVEHWEYGRREVPNWVPNFLR